MNDYERQFTVVYPKAFDLLGKKVSFQIEIDHKMVRRSGMFQVHRISDDKYLVDIETTDTPNPRPGTYLVLHLSQAHSDSISPANDPQQAVEFVVGLPFESHHYIPYTQSRQDAS